MSGRMLTVLLATRNRARILSEVLESFCLLQAPASGWKLVIVDNGSTDHTPTVVTSFVGRLPLHFVVEPTLGKNVALNTGLELLEGDLTVLTDDDVFPRSDWLVQLRRVADAQSAYSIFGGVIVPRWEVSPPRWVEWLDLGPIFTVTSPSMKEGELPPQLVTWVQGPNMAIRSDIFRAGTRFDTTIGPRGTNYAMGSESELLLRLSKQGHQAWHVQSAIVEHFVRKEQLEKHWVLQRAIRWGRGRYRLESNPKLWGNIPRHLFRDIPKEGLHMAAGWITFRQEALLRSRWNFNFLIGKGIEARNMARERRACKKSSSQVARRNS
jgi:glycosyltransferase involved in cell wall biosynthesis